MIENHNDFFFIWLVIDQNRLAYISMLGIAFILLHPLSNCIFSLVFCQKNINKVFIVKKNMYVMLTGPKMPLAEILKTIISYKNI